MKEPTQPLIANMTHGYFPGELEKLENVFEENASCVGESVHVFVDPTKGNKPKPIPSEWADMITRIKINFYFRISELGSGSKVKATPLMQYRFPVGGGPSSKTCPR